MISDNKVRFAVVGCGHIGKRHAAMISQNPDAELTALCDIRPKEALGLENYNVPFFPSIETLLASNLAYDVVVIAAPNGFAAVNYTNWLPNAGDRYMLNSLLGVKYVLSKTTLKWEGFELYGKSGALYIYKNNYALPFGIVQTRQVTQKMLASLIAPNLGAANTIRDIALINAVVLPQFDTSFGQRFALDELLTQQCLHHLY